MNSSGRGCRHQTPAPAEPSRRRRRNASHTRERTSPSRRSSSACCSLTRATRPSRRAVRSSSSSAMRRARLQRIQAGLDRLGYKIAHYDELIAQSDGSCRAQGA